MQCPIDGTELVMSARAGVEIDYCPRCRGVWLDRGELDKIIERSAGLGSTTPQPSHTRAPEPRREKRDDDDDDDRKRYKKKKRGGWLEDIFDFD